MYGKKRTSAKEKMRGRSFFPVEAAHIDGPAQFRVLWPSNRHLSPKIRVFVDFLSERLFVAQDAAANKKAAP
ncbi:hypothetical protein [Azospirillum cavernae]|uniref:hypothetical protein n=1 Tax=Azospirillum cavernae TaxID=2320860 RepID=UPI0018F6E8DA|nr:hypothetical protein [Azospirillum cavernae]